MSVPGDFLELLALHADCTDSILARASCLSPKKLEFTTERELIKIRRMVYSVYGELHVMCGFVRFSELGGLVLYGYLKPRHDIGSRVCGFHARRFPKRLVVLGNSARSWTALYTGDSTLHLTGGPLSQTVNELKRLSGCKDGQDMETFWKVYYWSQYSPKKHNLGYFKQCMPKKYLASAGCGVESGANRLTLDDY
jgi:probable DNA metabolism protein